MPKANNYLELIKLLIGENSMIFSGNMISCDSGEGNFLQTIYIISLGSNIVFDSSCF